MNFKVIFAIVISVFAVFAGAQDATTTEKDNSTSTTEANSQA